MAIQCVPTSFEGYLQPNATCSNGVLTYPALAKTDDLPKPLSSVLSAILTTRSPCTTRSAYEIHAHIRTLDRFIIFDEDLHTPLLGEAGSRCSERRAPSTPLAVHTNEHKPNDGSPGRSSSPSKTVTILGKMCGPLNSRSRNERSRQSTGRPR